MKTTNHHATVNRPVGTAFIRACRSFLWLLFFVAGPWINSLRAQTTLATGDLLFTGYDSNPYATAGDEYSFVLLTNIASGTSISFTERGYFVNYGWSPVSSGEGTVSWTCSTSLPRGTEVRIKGLVATVYTPGSGTGVVNGTMSLIEGSTPNGLSLILTGDQVIAFQGTSPTTASTFIAGLNFGNCTAGTSASLWNSGCNPGAPYSMMPPGLSSSTSAILIPPVGGNTALAGRFQCAGTPFSSIAALRAAVLNPANWTTTNSTTNSPSLPSGCTFLALPPDITTHPANRSVCAGGNTSFSASASDATGYQWQVNNGNGFVDLANGGVYSGVTTATLTITGATASLNNYQYRMVASGSGTATTNAATLNASNMATTGGQENISCFGGNDGSASVSVSGGVAPYSYAWAPMGGVSSSATGLAAGTYFLTVTDNIGCVVMRNFTITQPAAAVSGSTVVTNVACFGGSTGAINLTPSGGTAPYTFLWNNGATTEDRSNLPVGTHSVTITDANGCATTIRNITTTQPAAAVSGSTVVTNVSCFGGSNGAINLTPAGGVAPYTYAWNNGATIKDRTGLAAGTYSVTITDANGCQATISNITVAQPAAAVSASTVVTNVSCAGGDGAINLTPAGGTAPYTFNWGSGISTEDRTGLAAGTYSVTIADANGCQTALGNIIVSSSGTTPTMNAVGNKVVCNGASTAAIAFTGAGAGATYAWTNSNSGIGLAASGNGAIAAFSAQNTGVAATTATITVRPASGACIGNPISFTITVNPTPRVSAVSGQAVCAGVSTAAVSFTGPVTGTAYNWTNDNTAVGLVAAGSGTIHAFTAQNATAQAVAARITVTPVAAGCSGDTSLFVITVAPQPQVSALTVRARDQFLCTSGSSTVIEVRGGPANGSFAYTINGGAARNQSLNDTGAAVISTGSLSANATYHIVSATTAGGCSAPVGKSTTVFVGAIAANTPGNFTYCVGANVPAFNFSGNFPAGTRFSWTVINGDNVGLNMTDGTGTQLASFTASNATNILQTAYISVVPLVTPPAGCRVEPQIWAIRVHPQPVVVIGSGGDQHLCAGTLTAPVVLQSDVQGIAYRWTPSSATVGIAAGTTSAIPAFVAQNNTGTLQTTSFTITPIVGGACIGDPVTATIAVSPSVAGLSYALTSLCNSDAVSASPRLTGSGGGSYSYMNLASNTAAGLSLNTATGAVTPLSSAPGNYRVTYTLAGATGGCASEASATLAVLPSVGVAPQGNRTVCAGQPLSINFTSPQDGLVPGLQYNWTVTGAFGTNAALTGIPSSGTGNLFAFTPQNPTAANIVLKVTVSINVSGGNGYCDARWMSFYVTVRPCGPVTQSTGASGGTTTARTIVHLQQQEGSSDGLSVGPNPTANSVTVRLDAEMMKQGGVWSVQLLNQQGAPVSRAASFSGSIATVDLSGQPAGVYMLQLVDQKSGRIVRKQVVKL